MSAEDKNIKVMKDYLRSWRIGKAIELALKDDAYLWALFKLLHERDDDLKIRALVALEEVLKALPDVKRLILTEKFLDDMIKVLESNNDGVLIHAIRTIGRLIEGVPLPPEDFVKLTHAFKDIVKSRNNETVLLEIPSALKGMRATSYTCRLMNVISRLLKSKNLRLKAMGLRLLLNVSAYAGEPSLLKTLFSEIPEMLSEKDVSLADFALDILLEISHYPLREELVDDVARVLTAVKNLALRKSPELAEKARIVAEKLELAIHNYYLKNPEKARKKIHELLINERFHEAIDLALAVGDTYILKWLAETLEKLNKETLKINERVLPGPKYLSMPPEKKTQRYLKPPTLAQFKGGKKSAMEIALNAPAPRREMTEEEKAELKRAVEVGNEEKLVELSKRNPEVVFELIHKLEEGDKFEKMDALWALSKLAEKIETGVAFILEPAVEKLLEVAHSTKNRWMRLRAAKTLALLALKSRVGDRVVGEFLDDYLSGDAKRVVPALEFFSYYFDREWDEKTARVVLSALPSHFKKEETRFDALLTLEALVRSAPPDRAELFIPFVDMLKDIKKSASPEDQKLAIRILEGISSKVKLD